MPDRLGLLAVRVKSKGATVGPSRMSKKRRRIDVRETKKGQPYKRRLGCFGEEGKDRIPKGEKRGVEGR